MLMSPDTAENVPQATSIPPTTAASIPPCHESPPKAQEVPLTPAPTQQEAEQTGRQSQPAGGESDRDDEGSFTIKTYHENTPSPRSRQLPVTVQHLIVGDSLLKNLSRRKINSEGNAHVRTFSGGTYEDLILFVQQQQRHLETETVTCLVGSNNCVRKCDMLPQVERLQQAYTEKFPNARLAFCGIPPRLNDQGRKYNRNFWNLNRIVEQMCAENSFDFIPLDSYFTDKNNFAKTYLYTVCIQTTLALLLWAN